jgi:formylglycine-generating enzyme required for sulfatase activity
MICQPLQARFISLFCLLAMTACGREENSPSGRSNGTGTYAAKLIFPTDIPQKTSAAAQAITGIDCKAANISALEFTFLTKGAPDGPYGFACRADADINPDVPEIPGNNIDENCDGRVASPSSYTIDELDMTFVRIPAGTFTMGSPETELGREDDESHHQVTLTQAFYMQTTEVTQGQWQAVMGQNPSYSQNCGSNCPVENVSWNNVQEFLTRLNAQTTDDYTYRLPTEAQWEYAARAGSETAFYGGDITVPKGNDPILYTLGWYLENSDVGYA